MRLDKTEGGRDIKRELYNVKPFVEIFTKKLYESITYPSIECAEEATWEEPDCNS